MQRQLFYTPITSPSSSKFRFQIAPCWGASILDVLLTGILSCVLFRFDLKKQNSTIALSTANTKTEIPMPIPIPITIFSLFGIFGNWIVSFFRIGGEVKHFLFLFLESLYPQYCWLFWAWFSFKDWKHHWHSKCPLQSWDVILCYENRFWLYVVFIFNMTKLVGYESLIL